MRARVDFQAHTIRAAIRELVEPPRQRARTAGLLQQLRARLGRDVHDEYRAERSAALGERFSAEVGVALERHIDGFVARVRGRIDGVVHADAGPIVEEVKSVTLGRAELTRATPDELAAHCAQLRLYALSVAIRDDCHPRARLLLVSVVDGSRRTLDIDFDRAAAEAELDDLLRAAIAEAEALRARARRRAAAAAALAFPYAAPRPHQEALIERIAAALASRRPVLVAAPTGTGKTVSALLPGLRYALANDRPLVVATAKTTQRGLVADAFADIVAASGPDAAALTAVTLRAKPTMCPPGHGLCHPEACAYLEDFAARCRRGGDVEALVADGGHVSADAIYAHGESHRLCPFELSLEVAARAELIIGDYNHVYGEALGDDAGGRDAVVVIDEAHNLFDRARAQLSPFVSAARVAEVRERLRSGSYLAPEHRRGTNQLALADLGPSALGPKLFDDLAALFARLADILDATSRASGADRSRDGWAAAPLDATAWDSLADEAVAGMLRFALYHRRHQLVRPRDALVDVLCEVVRVRDALAAGERELVPYACSGRARAGAGVGVLCVDPARQLARCHVRAAGTVAMSATLRPLPYFADVLGFRELHPAMVSAPSPFPREHRRVVVASGVSTAFRDRDRHYRAIAELIERIVALRAGSYIAFFPSFAFLAAVQRHLALPDEQLLVQGPAMPDVERARVLARLRNDTAPRLLLAVTGGVFAEGVDLPGEALIGAIVVGPSLPPVGFERECMRRYFDRDDGRGFAYAMLYPGMQRVIQAAGRVIRTMSDRGVIALLGRRFALPDYAACLPPDWYHASPAELVVRDPIAELAAFWAEPEPATRAAPRSAPTLDAPSP